MPSFSEDFARPGQRFRPAAYWFWHDIPTAMGMRSQLSDFKNQGIGTVLIQCRLAFPRQLYMSAPFLSAYRQAVEIMAELGIVGGLYDDYNWNSGQAAGLTVSGRDELRETHLFWAVADSGRGEISGIEAPFSASMGEDIRNWIYDGGSPRFGEWRLVAAVLFEEGGALEAIVDVSDRVVIEAQPGGCAFAFAGDLPEGSRLLVALSARCLTSRLINYLMPEAGERFIEVGLQPYADVLAGLMPETLAFLFYDQPAAGFYKWPQQTGALGNSLLYAPSLGEAAEIACGYPLGAVLLALLRDVGPETSRLRSRFFKAYSDLLNKGFFEPLRRFCHAHGLRLTGHEVLPHVGSWALNGGFTSIDPRVAPAVDFFGIDRLRDETAVDANNFESQLSPKMGDSVARANGRSRAIVEIYATATRTERRGAGQWELSPATLRAQSIRMHLLGARQIILHALYQTDGSDEDERLFVNPRFDFAPGINFEPWWPHYRHIADETARLSVFLEDMVPEVPVALFYSLETAFAEGPRHDHARAFGTWCEILEDIGCGYMIIDETSLERATIADGLLHANGMAFRAVAFPSVASLSEKCRRAATAFRHAGGNIWATGDGPFSGLDIAVHVPLEQAHISGLVNNLASDAPDLMAPSPVRRAFGVDSTGWWRYALFNDSDVRQLIEIVDVSDLEIWNCLNGTITRHGDSGKVTIALEEGDVVCLRFRPNSSSTSLLHLPDGHRQPVDVQLLDRGWTFRTEAGEPMEAISVGVGWQEQGYSAYSGTGIYSCQVRSAGGWNAELELPGLSVATSVWLDGEHMGNSWRPPFLVQLGHLRPGTHRLELHVTNTAANRYYAGTSYAGDLWPDRSGLTKPPILRFFSTDNQNEEP